MCGRYDTTGRFTWSEIHAALSTFGEVRSAALNLEPNDDVRPTTRQAIARRDADGAFQVEAARWGFIPFWANGKTLDAACRGRDGRTMSTFNARTDVSPMFRAAVKSRRCVVPASGWYEWTGGKGAKVRHRFGRADGGLVWFAGLWSRVTLADAGEVQTFTIFTGPSEGWLAEYHDRQPVVLEPNEIGGWLDCANDPAPFFEARRPERFAAG